MIDMLELSNQSIFSHYLSMLQICGIQYNIEE
jgi:hypothetical protein